MDARTNDDAVTAALEAERRLLATRLQNTLINQINLVLAQINAYEQAASREAQMNLAVLGTLVRQLLQQAYDLEASLNPTTLEALGLEPALENLANRHRRANGVTVNLLLPHLRQRPPARIELALFRATQDITEYAIFQANASQIEIELSHTNEGYQLRIAHNGRLLDDGGLHATQQRIRRQGGQLTFQPGQVATITFPTETQADLTEREMTVIRLVAEGLTNAEIAAQLELRPRTVKFHLDNIYSKLGVTTRTAAAILALRQGWV